MKKLIIATLAFWFGTLSPILLFGQADSTSAATDLNSLVNYIPSSWIGIIGTVLVVYEVAVLAIPSAKNNSILNKLGSMLKYISESLNRRKK